MANRPGKPRGRLSAWVAVIAIATGLLAGAATANAEPAKFWGIDPQETPTEEQLQRLKTGGVDSFRIPIVWQGAEPSPGVFEWGGADLVVGRAARAGLEVLPFLSGAPTWAVKTVSV